MPNLAPFALLDATLRGMLLALLLLMAQVLARDRPRLRAARAGAALCLGLCVQVVGATPWLEARLPLPWLAPVVAVSVANAVLFWVFVQALFDDDFRFRPLHAAAWAGAALLSGINCVLGPQHALASVTFGLQRAVPLLFAVLAVVAAWAHWRSDLVDGRRRLRAFIVTTGVAYTLLMLALRLAAPQGRLSESTATLDVVLLLFMVAVMAAQWLRLGASDVMPAQRSIESLRQVSPPGRPTDTAPDADAQATAAASPPDPAEERLAEALSRLMREQRVYRAEDLTVANLAARLAAPEYRVRRLINRRLGHRNFNAYVNSFRLDEAQGALADVSKRERPILTIALEAGFQSIGPFNRAFKAATGLTPTEFRRAKLADS